MKYLIIEKSKRVSVKPYQRKGKYVIGYQREDPRNLREKVQSDRKNKEGEPYELGAAYIGVPDSFVKFIQTTVPIDELRGLKSIEEFSFQHFEDCKTIPKEPYLEFLERGYKEHPDYGGMYFHDIARFVLDSTNEIFKLFPEQKERAFLHEIGHHQWWYHTTKEDRREFISTWERDRIGKILTSPSSGEKWKILATSETTTNGKYELENIKTGKIYFYKLQDISSWGLGGVTYYSNANAHEGFAEAYAEFRAKSLSEKKFPETYHLIAKILERRKQNVMVEALEGKKGEGAEVKTEPWKGNVLEWVSPKRAIPPKTSEARARNWETFKGTIKTGEIDDKLPLTDKSKKYWGQNKSELGYANLRGLSEEDVRSILSAVRRGEASVTVNRMGKLAFYKLRKKEGEAISTKNEVWAGKGKHPYFGQFKLSKTWGAGLGVATEFTAPEGHIVIVFYDAAYIGAGRGTKQKITIRFKNKKDKNDMGYIPSYFEKTFWEKEGLFDRSRVDNWLNKIIGRSDYTMDYRKYAKAGKGY